MKKWPHAVRGTTKADIVRYCVEDERWQKFRLSMKGKATEVKLDMLDHWANKPGNYEAGGELTRRCQVQIDNYINALKRGGQLNDKCEVVR